MQRTFRVQYSENDEQSLVNGSGKFNKTQVTTQNRRSDSIERAGRTSNATEQIQASISAMLATIQSWQKDILANKEQTDTCSQVAEQSALRLSEVEQMMQSMSGLMVDVAEAANNQLKLSSDVNQHIHSIASTAEQNLAATHSVEQNSRQLKEQVQDFYQLALRFEDK